MTTSAKTHENELTPIKFNFFKINFTPYSANSEQSAQNILREVITFLNKEMMAGRGLLVDRHEKREKDVRRPLFVTSAVTKLREKRITGSIALLRTGKIPLLKPADKFLLIPFDKSKGEIAEQTHFFIDYSTDNLVLCLEFNYNGPRVSDLEFYFRVVARDKLRIARATDIEMYMDTSIDKALADLKNVLNFDVKVQPAKLAQLDTALVGQYFTGITNLGQKVQPKFIKLEAMFQTPGKQYVSSEINKGANTMFTSFLNAFKAKPINIDVFEQFVVRYEDKDGREEIFNLLRGKKEVTKYVDLSKTTGRAWYELIDKDLTEFVQSL